MRITQEDALAFHCPRWSELPDLSLYMDQVMIVLEGALSLFADAAERIITPAMINNYVRLKLVTPPVKKKYGREQLALLMMVCVFKKVLSISEIMALIALMTEEMGLEGAYDSFCRGLEGMLRQAFSARGEASVVIEPPSAKALELSPANAAEEAALMALMGKMLVQNHIARLGD